MHMSGIFSFIHTMVSWVKLTKIIMNFNHLEREGRGVSGEMYVLDCSARPTEDRHM